VLVLFKSLYFTALHRFFNLKSPLITHLISDTYPQDSANTELTPFTENSLPRKIYPVECHAILSGHEGHESSIFIYLVYSARPVGRNDCIGVYFVGNFNHFP